MGGPIGDMLVSYEFEGYMFMQDATDSWFLCGYNWNTYHFKYLHQLQNIYFALTGTELTFNQQ